MIVVHIATSLAGGAGLGLLRYHRALRAQGVDSRLLVLKPPAGLGSEADSITWQKHPLPFRLAQRLGLAHTPEQRLHRRLVALAGPADAAAYELFTLPHSDYRPEDHPWVQSAAVINLHWVAGILDWPRFLGTCTQPVVLTLHDQQPYLGGFHYALDAAANPALAVLEAEVRTIKQRALQDHRLCVIANSAWNATEAAASGFFPAGTPIETILYPLDTTLYAPRPKAAAKAALDLAANQLVVGFACENLNNRRKGFADLVAALALLPADLRGKITLLSFGRDPATDLRALVNLPWRHLGYLETEEAKVAAYAAMDLFVAPSRAEAFGLTAIEAQATGVPVVATPVGGLLEAVPTAREDYGEGSPSPEHLAAALERLLSDAARREQRATNGRQSVIARHNPAAVGRQLADFHRRACA
ncbi:D-inositol 3-phosphate glycosyltransferase [Lacunisphaera limnophila]|uniref:D-inositol 3-phosphate glycosyltransferase n=1 Tax=Lacunisphaera limnophila TaxID=1838286 RepID=A0A1D8AXZ1_9BACT|nr:glycosyltransferase [Lacunisphaera limnophila]AOS45747.1 D-inositol 3-phosphate glycosyltransferase [Lacunisphaera limnophila]